MFPAFQDTTDIVQNRFQQVAIFLLGWGGGGPNRCSSSTRLGVLIEHRFGARISCIMAPPLAIKRNIATNRCLILQVSHENTWVAHPRAALQEDIKHR